MKLFPRYLQSVIFYFNFHSAHNNWWVYPVLGQLIGGVIGGCVYELTIGIHHPLDEEEVNETNDVESAQEAGGSASGSNPGSKDTSPRTKN